MTMNRKHTLIECNPYLLTDDIGTRFIAFECPEGHHDCRTCIPFTPTMEGVEVGSPQSNGAVWRRTGDTFDNMTFAPSIRRIPKYPDRAAAIAEGLDEKYIEDSLFCAMHIFIQDGKIVFCGDSK